MKSRIAALGILVFSALGCVHAPPPPPETPVAAAGERFQLRPEESMQIAGTPVKITFEKIVSDNRCAVDVVCIVAGEARALLRLDQRGKLSIGFELDTGRTPRATVNGYRVSLVGVSPAPLSTIQIDPRSYVVELIINPEPPAQKSSPPS